MLRPLVVLVLLGAPAFAGPRCHSAACDAQAGLADALAPALPDAGPLQAPARWPRSVASTQQPLRVHYRAGQRAQAWRTLRLLEAAWRREVDGLGFAPPPSDAGAIGPDARFDVYLWRDHEECYVDVVDGADGALLPYMVVDPWGPYGGDQLAATLAHELNHACQAAYGWTGELAFMESTATFVEGVLVPDGPHDPAVWADFQARPERALDWEDDYESWFMYGGALYLRFLHDEVFGDARFAARMWAQAGTDDPERQDFVGALDGLLRAQGSSFLDSLTAFARWRRSPPDDVAAVAVAKRLDPTVTQTVELRAALLGSVYIELQANDAARVRLSVDTPAGVRVVASSSGVVQLEAGEHRVVSLTLLPADGKVPAWDDRQALRRVRLELTPLP